MPDKARASAWPRVAFGDVVRLSKERCGDPLENGIERYVGLEHIEPNDLKIRSWGEVADGTTFTSVFRPGQVLFGKRRAYQRKVAVADFSGVCSGDIYALEPADERLLPELLPFLCQTDRFFEHAVGTSAGSLSPRTNWKQLSEYEFSLPPLEEQRRIIEVLEASTRMTNALRDSRDRIKDLLRASAKSFFIEGSLGVESRIGDVAQVVNGTTPSRKRPDYWGGSIPWLPTGKVGDRFIDSADEFITDLALEECSLSVVPSHSTLVAMIGQGKTRGRAAYLKIDATINQNFAAIVPGEAVEPRFLFYQMDFMYEALRHWSQGSNQLALNTKLVADFPFRLPSMAEQRSVVRVLDELEAGRRQLLQREDGARELLSALLSTSLDVEAE